MLKTTIQTTIAVFCLLLCGITPTKGQSLYLEAIEMIELLDKNSIWVKIETDSLGAFPLSKIQKGQPLQSVYTFESPADSFHIKADGRFMLSNQGLYPFTLTIQYDTVVIKQVFEPADSIALITIQNNPTDLSVKANGKNRNWDAYLTKYHYAEVQGILQSSMHARSLPDEPVSINFTKSRQLSDGNPFLKQLFPPVYFQVPNWRDSMQLVGQISSMVKHYAEEPTSKALDLLYQSDGFEARFLPSIQQITKDYTEPPVSAIQAVQESVSNISASQTQAGERDFSTTLITGLADFVLERAQEEFNYTFMRNLRTKLDAIPELGVLFPQSKNFLETIDLPNYKSLLINARNAFTDDLNLVGIRLPDLLNLPKYQSLDTVPAIFNMLTIYNMVDFAYRGVAIDTIVPLAFSELLGRRQQLNKRANLELAKQLKGSAPLSTFATSIATHEQKLNEAYDKIAAKQSKLLGNFTTQLIRPDLNQLEKVKQLYAEAQADFVDVYRKLRVGWDTITVIPSYLQGRPAYDYILRSARVDDYEKYFGQAPNEIQLVAAGLEMSRIMLDGYGTQENKARMLRTWDQAIDRADTELALLVASFEKKDTLAELRAASNQVIKNCDDLRKDILQDTSFWQGKGAPEFDIEALKYLAATLGDGNSSDEDVFFFVDRTLPEDASIVDTIRVRRNYVNEVRGLVKSRLDTMKVQYSPGQNSPLLDAFEVQPEPIPLREPTETEKLTTTLINEAATLSAQLGDLRQDGVPNYLKAMNNADNFARVLEFTAHLMYCFKGDPSTGKKWLTAQQFNEVMSNSLTREAYLGLMFQRLSSLDLGPKLSSDGVASLATSLINTISDVNIQKDSIKVRRERNERLGFQDYYPFLRTTVNFLNDVITTPIIAPKPTGLNITAPARPLTQQFGVLKDIPMISTQTLDLFDNISRKEYGPAMTNLVQLYETIAFRADSPCDDPKDENCTQIRRTKTNILKYGTFFAGVASAKQPGDISAAFAAAAVPKGSSRTKRVNMMDFGLNAYFGGSFGRENSRLLNENEIWPFNNASLSVPIGLSLSFKTSPTQKGSWTLFAPILDLGAVTSFRIDDPNSSDLPELKFENVISPGLIGLYNFANSPFSVGAGWQYGPNTRTVTINNVDLESSSYRWVIFFGIDVPIFDFYTKEKE